MTPAQFRRHAIALCGKQWKRALSPIIAKSERMVQHYATGAVVPAEVQAALKRELLEKADHLRKLAATIPD